MPFDFFRKVNPRRRELASSALPTVGPFASEYTKGGETVYSEENVRALELLERTAYERIAELISENQITEAEKVADVLKALGVV